MIARSTTPARLILINLYQMTFWKETFVVQRCRWAKKPWQMANRMHIYDCTHRTHVAPQTVDRTQGQAESCGWLWRCRHFPATTLVKMPTQTLYARSQLLTPKLASHHPRRLVHMQRCAHTFVYQRVLSFSILAARKCKQIEVHKLNPSKLMWSRHSI